MNMTLDVRLKRKSPDRNLKQETCRKQLYNFI